VDIHQYFDFQVLLTAVDWTWVVLFLVLMTACGILFYRLGKRSEADFFLAGRGLPWWLPASSVYATHTATDTPMWVGGVIYEHGLRGIWFTFFSSWCAISALVSTRIFRRSLAYSQAEWQSLRFSGLGAELLRGWLAGWQIFMNMFILGWVGIAMGKVCHIIFAWPDWIGLVLFSSICAVYVLTAGYWGVVMADFQQGVIAFMAIVIVSVWAVAVVGGPGEIAARLTEMGQDWRLNPFAFTGLVEGDFPMAWFFTMLFMALLAGFGMGTYIDWYAESQRIQSAKTVRDASYSIWSGSALVLVRNGFWAVAILGFFVLFPNVIADVTAQGGTTEQAKQVYEVGWFVMGFKFLPIGLLGFFFAAIVAIHFSTISTHLNLGAMYATRDIYHHYIKPKAGEKELVWVGRVSTLILLLGSFLYGLMMESITTWLIFAIWIMSAGIWLPSLLQVIWWRFNSWGYLTAWMANLGLSWLIVWVLPSFGFLSDLKDYHQFWILMALGIIIYLPATYLTRPEKMDNLVKFYVMSRPIGWWGPVRREAERRGLLDQAKAVSAEAGSQPSA
jgi:SSS family solute:Na+ symporter